MLGGTSCNKSGGKLGGSNCSKVGGKSKSTKPKVKKVKKVIKVKKVKKVIKSGGLCIGNLHPFDLEETITAQQPFEMQNKELSLTGGADKKKKKRKAGPYALFVKKNFAVVKKKEPNMKASDCMKKIAIMWNEKKNK